MSSGSPRLSSRGWRTRWIGAGLVAARRGLGFGALMVAGTGLLLALAAPLILGGSLSGSGSTVVVRPLTPSPWPLAGSPSRPGAENC